MTRDYKGSNPNPLRCMADVGTYYSVQCHHKRKVGKYYCGVHDPIAKAQKNAIRAAEREKAWAIKSDAWHRAARLNREYPLIAAEFIQYLEDNEQSSWADAIRERIK